MVSRPFNIFETTCGTSARGEDKHFFRFAVSLIKPTGLWYISGYIYLMFSVFTDQNPINGSKKKNAHVTSLTLGVCTSGHVHNGINVVCID